MTSLTALKRAVQHACRLLARIKDVQEAEAYASSTGHLLCRLNYTSDIPCNGVEEPKSSESFGIGIRAAFTTPDGRHVGFGSEARDLSLHGIRRAIEKARQNAVPDPDFVSLPMSAPDSGRKSRRPSRYDDRAIMELKDSRLVETGWRVIEEALKAFASSEQLARLAGSKDKVGSLSLVVSGDVSFYQQRLAIASTRMPRVQTDESTLMTSNITSMVERKNAKGSGYAAATHLSKFKGEAGAEAVRNAINGSGGQRLRSGPYTVILGPQPVADLMTHLVLPSLTADAFYACRSAFLGELGRTVTSTLLTIYDHGAARGLVGSRNLTCEGLPTGRTDLIREGVLTGLLSNHYQTQRLLKDPRARDKLGIYPQEHPECLVPRNGFRTSNRGGRQFDTLPSVVATNVQLEGATPQTTESLLRLVDQGVYIGRIWYTYPINGLRAGEFTCTVVGDSYLIQDGRLTNPILPNSLRISGNIRQVLQNVLGVTKQSRPIVGWGADEVIYAPEIAVRDLPLSDIAQYMETV